MLSSFQMMIDGKWAELDDNTGWWFVPNPAIMHPSCDPGSSWWSPTTERNEKPMARLSHPNTVIKPADLRAGDMVDIEGPDYLYREVLVRQDPYASGIPPYGLYWQRPSMLADTGSVEVPFNHMLSTLKITLKSRRVSFPMGDKVRAVRVHTTAGPKAYVKVGETADGNARLWMSLDDPGAVLVNASQIMSDHDVLDVQVVDL